MFGFFKKLFGGKPEKEVKRIDRRKRQRRQMHSDRREDVRWEPEKIDRRSGKDRRSIDKWDDNTR